MQPFEHVTRIEPESEWRQDALGLFTRVRSIAAAVFADAAGSTVSFLWIHWTLGVLIIAAGIFTLCSVLIIRHYRLQRMRADIRLHEFCHEARDECSRILEFDKKHAKEAVLALQRFHEDTVQRAAAFFRELTGDSTVNCGIRIAETVNGVESYVTKARSDGLDKIARNKHSEPIPANMGLANAIRLKRFEGVFIIRDIEAAVSAGVWHKTKNDNLSDIRTLMVAPVNAYELTNKVMCGIFYVTSKKDTFKPSHTLPLKAIVDLLGLVYPIIISKITQLNVKRQRAATNKSGKKSTPKSVDESPLEPECLRKTHE